MKKLKLITVLLLIVSLLSGCASPTSFNKTDFVENTTTDEKATVKQDIIAEENVYLSENELNLAYSNPDKYKEKKIKVSGRVFSEPEYDDTYIAFQMFADTENNEKNTIVFGLNDGLDLKSDDYVIVEGVIQGAYGGENAFGGSVNALQIVASKIKKSNYQTVVSPTIKTKKVNKTIKQHGYSITLKKVEFAETETRLYFKINNNGISEFYFYSFDTKILQGNNQYEEQVNYDADYEEPQSELMIGAETEGIIAFPAFDYNKRFEVYCEGSSNNWDEEFTPFIFNVN